MEKRIMLVGLAGSGKSTLSDYIEGEVTERIHREDCWYRRRSFEVPGSYIENHWMNSTVIMLAQNQACAMVLCLDATGRSSLYSSGYARAVTVPSLGVVTKCENAMDKQRQKGLYRLHDAGCNECLCLSTVTGEGVQRFMTWAEEHLPESLRISPREEVDSHAVCNRG